MPSDQNTEMITENNNRNVSKSCSQLHTQIFPCAHRKIILVKFHTALTIIDYFPENFQFWLIMTFWYSRKIDTQIIRI